MSGIRAIDSHSVHRITSGQVIVDLQTAIKELVENALDAGASIIDVRFQNYGLKSIEVVDNGSGIALQDYDSIALKHYTSKLSSFEDLTRVLTFGFRGEALSSLCALSDGVTVTTATASDAPMGTILEIDRNGRVKSRNGKVARQRGTTVAVSTLFKPLPVRRKELERNIKREFNKALNMLYAYALVPCSRAKSVRLTVTNVAEGGRKSVLFKTDGTLSLRSSVTTLWGARALDSIVELDLSFDVEPDKVAVRRQSQGNPDQEEILSAVAHVRVKGLVSKFALGTGRTTSDRQYFYVNGRPYNPGKVQKAFNEVYRTFNPNQSPFIVADFILPTHTCDINVSPDKRTIFLHSENNLVQALKESLELAFESSRSTFDVCAQSQPSAHTQTRHKEKGHSQELLSPPPPVTSINAECPDADVQDKPRQGTELIGHSIPHLLLEPPAEGEGEQDNDEDQIRPPSPTLVASSSDIRARKGERMTAGTNRIHGNGGERLFLSDDEDEEDMLKPIAKPRDTSATSSSSTGPPVSGSGSRSAPAAAPSSQSAPAPELHRSKPRSVQTVLNTSGAVWNLTRDAGAHSNADPGPNSWVRDGHRNRNEEGISTRSLNRRFANRDSGGRLVKRARLSDVQGGFVGVNDIESEEQDSDDAIEVAPSASDGQKARPTSSTRPSPSSQETLALPSEDEGEDAMDVDSTASSKERRMSLPEVMSIRTGGSSAPPRPDSNGLVVDLTTDDWDISPTLVGSSTQGPKPCASPGEEDVNVNRSKGKERKTKTSCVVLRVDIESLHAYYSDTRPRRRAHLTSTSAAMHPSKSGAGKWGDRSAVEHANFDSAAPDEVASAALSRIISKADFMNMDILGQFNLGFIIVRKRTPDDERDSVVGEQETELGSGAQDDLFIVDQHAADEKWNFETLQEKTVIESQRLFRPQPLHLTAADELIAVENMDILKRNGFEVAQLDSSADTTNMDHDEEEGDEEGMQSGRLHLLAQPVSKDTVFDMKDLDELIHLIQDRPKGTIVRCSKTRAMFAMRACRRSVMIGMPLDKSRMASIVRHMGTMDQPWNCPHGRPTMRHLSDLRCFGGYELAVRGIDWEAFRYERTDDDLEG